MIYPGWTKDKQLLVKPIFPKRKNLSWGNQCKT